MPRLRTRPAGDTIEAMPVETLITACQLALLPEDDFFYELDEGELIQMPPPGEEHGWVQDEVYGPMFGHVRARRLGKTYVETGFLLKTDPDVVRAPDLAFIRKERLPVACHRSGYILGAPDLAVEVQSPSQSPADMRKKVRQYLAAGALIVWVVYPRRRQVVVHYASGKTETLSAGQHLEAPDLLPGLRIPLAEIFKPE